jgi:uncharacterized protein (DUF58 family)
MFKAASSLLHKMRRQFTTAGQFVFYAMCAAAALTIDVRHLMAYQIFSMLFVMITFSILHAFIFRGRFSVRRTLPPCVTAGKEFTYSITVECDSKKVRRDVSLMETLEDPRPTWREFKIVKEPPMRMTARNTLVAGTIKSGPQDLQPGLAAEFRLSATPLRRGRIVFKSVSVTAPDPLGLVRASKRVARPETLVVLPARYRLPRLTLSGGRKHHPGGVTLASSVGESEEFYCLRDYVPGDSIRHIDWKSWAKTGKPVTRTYQEEYFSHHALVMDTFADDAFTEVFEVCVSTAASLLMSVDTQESLLDLIFVKNEVYCITTGRNVSDKASAMEMLASLKLSPEKTFSTLAASIKARAPMLNSLICVFIKWDEERRELTRYIRGLGVSITVLLVMEPSAKNDSEPPLDDYVCLLNPKNPEAALMGLAGRL